MTSARATLVGVLLCAALAVVLAREQPDLRPVMPEVDGVHPVRALVALRTAFVPGEGFLDKYPPLGSFVFGLAVALGDARGLSAQAESIVAAPPAERRARLWELRDEVAEALARERWVSRLAAAACAALVFLLAQRLGGLQGTAGAWAVAGPLLVGGLFAASPTQRVYAGTANVDALALVPALGALLLLLQSRWVAAGAALALAVALKDPQVVLVPVVLGGAAWLGGPRALLRASLAAGAVYVVAAGALTAPGTWWEHVQYLTTGGVEHVSRLDHSSLRGWGWLLAHVVWLLGEGRGLTWLVLLVGLAAYGPLSSNVSRGHFVLLLAAALAPILLFVLPVGFAYARFLLVPQALILVGLGATAARLIAQWRTERVGRPGLLPFLLALVVLMELGDRLLMQPALDPAHDPRREVVARLEALSPEGGRVLLFADEREHGPPLDPARWELDAHGLGEVGEVLAEVRGRNPADRPEVVLVMSFDNALPSGAPGPETPQPQPGERVADMYVVSDVLGGPSRSWVEHAIALRPAITVLERAD